MGGRPHLLTVFSNSLLRDKVLIDEFFYVSANSH